MTPPSWASFHLFHQGSRDRMLLDLVAPLVATLRRESRVNRFFFIRYGLGGPHVRLRLEIPTGQGESVRNRLATACADYFRRFPSDAALSEEEIRRTNRNLMANDPGAEDVVYPNDSWIEEPFRSERERYGGEALLDHSLDFFAVSSARVLLFLRSHADLLWPRRAPELFRLFTRYALGLSSNPEELVDRSRQPLISWGEHAPVIVVHADRVFERQRGAFLRLLASEIDAFVLPEEGNALDDAAMGHRLSWEVRMAPASVRRNIAVGQLHMTANRLGLINAEEVYLARMIERSLEALEQEDRARWSSLQRTFAERAKAGSLRGERLRDALPRFLDETLAGYPFAFSSFSTIRIC